MPKHSLKKHSVNRSLLLSLGAIIVVGLLMVTVGKVSPGQQQPFDGYPQRQADQKSQDCQAEC